MENKVDTNIETRKKNQTTSRSAQNNYISSTEETAIKMISKITTVKIKIFQKILKMNTKKNQ
ncbi:hypothetical protein JCM21714_931 [Gracilibacillus boraciitolerans JCM 21714]|uniref:Uncharacterized protein n=1 Tax=Gracilibacillus boraciitolerans JCM 21714 TaxID=1298598 RepID=W4VGT7_9BACI|nr:hypothetical protein [Gracilibacillus boraciitolerans]GAE91959.1 hypothetical protein JCM21714_931 [Gracilibacillus boraciitolerans JCM 21714]